MSAELWAAWRFVLPDVDGPVSGVSRAGSSGGLATGPAGRIELVRGVDAIRQGILLLLTTMPGERLMRPEYGCHLFRLLFSPNDATTAGLAMHYVRAAVERWEPRVEVVALTAERSEFNPGALEIRLQYRVRATQGIDSVVVDLPLSGGSPAGRTATGVRRP